MTSERLAELRRCPELLTDAEKEWLLDLAAALVGTDATERAALVWRARSDRYCGEYCEQCNDIARALEGEPR